MTDVVSQRRTDFVGTMEQIDELIDDQKKAIERVNFQIRLMIVIATTITFLVCTTVFTNDQLLISVTFLVLEVFYDSIILFGVCRLRQVIKTVDYSIPK